MVDSGQRGVAATAAAIEAVPFAHPRCPGLGLEVMTLARLRERLPARHRSARSRPDFHQLILVEAGRTEHDVDFVRHAVPAGSVLVVRAGQVQQFVDLTGAQGQLVLFRPEFVLPEAALGAWLGPAEAGAIALSGAEQERIGLAVRALAAACEGADGQPLTRALQHLLLALLLQLAHAREQGRAASGPAGPARVVRRFEQALEERFATEREAAAYARQLGCSHRTLSRACLALAGATPRQLIERRVALEAKRLLAHSALTVSAIGLELGFSEPTNFVKFFKRCAGMTPAAFRAQQSLPVAGPAPAGRDHGTLPA